jgi:NADH:ubiquinone oxidoreductase subunit 6 (subunit J)
MDLTALFFLIFAGLTVGCAVMVVASKDIVHSVVYLAATFIGVGIIYMFLNDQRPDIVRYNAYKAPDGGGRGMRRRIQEEVVAMKGGDSTQAIVVKLLTVGLLLELMMYSVFSLEWGDVGSTLVDTAQIGEVLFNQYGIAVLMLGLLLLSAILGGVFIAQEEEE